MDLACLDCNWSGQASDAVIARDGAGRQTHAPLCPMCWGNCIEVSDMPLSIEAHERDLGGEG